MANGKNSRRRKPRQTGSPAPEQSAAPPTEDRIPIPPAQPEEHPAAAERAEAATAPRRQRQRARRDESQKEFQPKVLDRTVIAIPLLKLFEAEPQRRRKTRATEPEVYAVIIDLNLDFPGTRLEARRQALDLVQQALAEDRASTPGQGIDEPKSEYSQQYLFGRFTAATIKRLVQLDRAQPHRAIYRIWPDFKVKALINKSVSTVKADAARVSFSAMGEDIVWAVLDSGIDATHPHFQRHKNLEADPPLQHRDFTVSTLEDGRPCEDAFGHGTHVAGIIAGELRADEDGPIQAVMRQRDEDGEVRFRPIDELSAMSGMAPRCKLLSLKVLDERGDGDASSLIAALSYIQEINGYGQRLRIHGVNMSVGYSFDPEWFACGQSPLCVEVDRLVRSGVVVVVAAGNSGYGWAQSEPRGPVNAGLDLTINDPGNAELAISVGSTHRYAPHVYGISYFSSKGPTGDGRLKPDVVAPGEKILSCATGKPRAEIEEEIGRPCDYREDSGTSMAAPHVSGVIAAFLSVRQEFIGQPERIKQIFLSTATDLRRDRYFQGHGLIDLMRAIQSV
ncbi:MAG TPA: S8 family peptidase [Herpetosiphonaceae bacterium]